jgi:lysophospholipase L1-like esterase
MVRFAVLGLIVWMTYLPVSFAQTTFIALGDSLTEGVGDDDWITSSPPGYPGRLHQRLQTDISTQHQVINLGQSGWTAADVLNGNDWTNPGPSQVVLAEAEIAQALATGREAVALVWVGSNDLWAMYNGGCDENSPPSCATAWVDDYRANLDAILSRLSGAGAQLIVGLLDDHSKRPVASDGTFDITEAEQPLLAEAVQAFNDVITELAAVYGAWTVDFYNTTIFEDAATLYEDGNHPNSAGYDVIADLWFAAAQNLLSSESGGDYSTSSNANVYRFYNTQTNTHFYTISPTERDMVIAQFPNFVYEGSFFAALTGPASGAQPVYRLYNTQTGTHFYTINAAEREAIPNLYPWFIDEGPAYYAFATAVDGSIPLYRFYNTETGAHFFTPSDEERAAITQAYAQFQDEGVAFYVSSAYPTVERTD